MEYTYIIKKIISYCVCPPPLRIVLYGDPCLIFVAQFNPCITVAEDVNFVGLLPDLSAGKPFFALGNWNGIKSIFWRLGEGFHGNHIPTW
ncbi:hypothetical protein GDO86_018804 [Hymenochirus boettgeri]|uniref:Uncharacterized protein n=1 Tax=Hymenochirus boettgeri TaxID=247094 RepID=A0A8T2IDH9_9PIPI|nr:hypothetical protein GDO86_018804 [Hymenochirus boettgeri]